MTEREPCTCGAEIDYVQGRCRNGHDNMWVFQQRDQEPADWRLNPAVLRDDNGAILEAEDVGLAAGEKVRASYVRDHPEYPWPAALRQAASETAPVAGALVAFIRARLDEAANVAQQAIDEETTYPQSHDQPMDKRLLYPYPERLARCVHDGLHNPRRALLGVAAKRQIVDAYVIWLDAPKIDPYGRVQVAAAAQGARLALFGALSALASEWSDHPDHQAEWTP